MWLFWRANCREKIQEQFHEDSRNLEVNESFLFQKCDQSINFISSILLGLHIFCWLVLGPLIH